MNILNRREVFLTWRIEDLYRIVDCLSKNNIKYRVKRNSLLEPGKTRGAGICADAADKYRVYVYKDDYERAKRAIEAR